MEEDQKPTEASATDDTGAGSNPNRKRNIIIAASVAAVLLLAAAGGGYAYADMNVGKGMYAAQAYAQSVDQRLADKIAKAQQLADDTTAGQVDDQNVLEKLADAIDSAGKLQGVPDTDSNPYMAWTLLNAQSTYDSDAEDAQAAIKSLDTAMSAVSDAVQSKTLKTAQDALIRKVDEAKKLLTDSDGKVQDNATRDTLQKAIDDTNDTNADADTLNELTNVIQQAMDSVNASMQAKTDADRKAAEEAAANTAASASNGYNSSGYSGGYTGGGYTGNTGGGYTGDGYNGGNTGGGNTGQSVTGTGGQWFGGNSVNGIYGYDDIGGAWTPLEGDSWEFTDSW